MLLALSFEEIGTDVPAWNSRTGGWAPGTSAPRGLAKRFLEDHAVAGLVKQVEMVEEGGGLRSEDHVDHATHEPEFFHAFLYDSDDGRPSYSIMGRDARWNGLL